MNEKNARKTLQNLIEETGIEESRFTLMEPKEYASPSSWGIRFYAPELFGNYEDKTIYSPDELEDLEEEFPALKTIRRIVRDVRKNLSTLVTSENFKQYFHMPGVIRDILEQEAKKYFPTCSCGTKVAYPTATECSKCYRERQREIPAREEETEVAA